MATFDATLNVLAPRFVLGHFHGYVPARITRRYGLGFLVRFSDGAVQYASEDEVTPIA